MIPMKVGAIDLGYGSVKYVSQIATFDGGQMIDAKKVSEGEFLSRVARAERRGKVSLGIRMAKNPLVEFVHPAEEKTVYKYRVGDPDAPDSLSPSSRQLFWQYPDTYAMICYALSLIAKPSDSQVSIIYGVPVGWLDLYKKTTPTGMPNVFKFSVTTADDQSPKAYNLAVQSRIGGQTIGGVRFILSKFPLREQLDDWAVVDIGYGTTDVVVMRGNKPLVIPTSLDYGISNEAARQRLETGQSQTELNDDSYGRIVDRISTEIMYISRAHHIRKFFLIGGGGAIIASRNKEEMLTRDIKICSWKEGFSSSGIQVIIPPYPRMVNCYGLLEMLCAEIAKRTKKQ